MIRSVVIVAGGKGLRMGSALPKQFLLINGKPLLMYTIEAFHLADKSIRVILVLPRTQQLYWKSLCEQYHFTIEHEVTDGGETRFQSVKNGLALTLPEGIIGVHDGVRPLVSKEVICRCFNEVAKFKAVVPVIDMVESVRQITPIGGNISVDRCDYKLVQTPQVFDASLLHRAYGQTYSPLFTDDASVVEALGAEIHLTAGNRENIKITTRFDMSVANALLKCRM